MSHIKIAPDQGAMLMSSPANQLENGTRQHRAYEPVKRAFDILVAGSALLVMLPVFLALWIAVRRDGGRAFFGHTRVGRNGRSFPCLKFRSMVPDANVVLAKLLAEDPEAARQWRETRKLKHDPRITWLGRFLRATSLDELPQLINVLRGDMSLVGPRPVVQDELDHHYGSRASAYLSVRPGITGLWQTSGRSNTSYEARVAMDWQYVANLSLRNDLLILLRTAPAVLKRTGAH